VLLVDVYFLLVLSLLNIREIKRILILSTAVPLFTVIMLIPSIMMGNVTNSILLVLKVVGTIIAINTLSCTTGWHDIIKALKKFFIPDIFILVFDITLRYIYILGEFALDMFYSLKLRSVGKNHNKYSSVSKLMGSLFLKSKEMGDEMYCAMECRGFTGEYISHAKFKFKLVDFLYLMANIFIIGMYFYITGMRLR
jgi:cobalt/nickel transport system permease protein